MYAPSCSSSVSCGKCGGVVVSSRVFKKARLTLTKPFGGSKLCACSQSDSEPQVSEISATKPACKILQNIVIAKPDMPLLCNQLEIAPIEIAPVESAPVENVKGSMLRDLLQNPLPRHKPAKEIKIEKLAKKIKKPIAPVENKKPIRSIKSKKPRKDIVAQSLKKADIRFDAVSTSSKQSVRKLKETLVTRESARANTKTDSLVSIITLSSASVEKECETESVRSKGPRSSLDKIICASLPEDTLNSEKLHALAQITNDLTSKLDTNLATNLGKAEIRFGVKDISAASAQKENFNSNEIAKWGTATFERECKSPSAREVSQDRCIEALVNDSLQKAFQHDSRVGEISSPILFEDEDDMRVACSPSQCSMLDCVVESSLPTKKRDTPTSPAVEEACIGLRQSQSDDEGAIVPATCNEEVRLPSIADIIRASSSNADGAIVLGKIRAQKEGIGMSETMSLSLNESMNESMIERSKACAGTAKDTAVQVNAALNEYIPSLDAQRRKIKVSMSEIDEKLANIQRMSVYLTDKIHQSCSSEKSVAILRKLSALEDKRSAASAEKKELVEALICVNVVMQRLS